MKSKKKTKKKSKKKMANLSSKDWKREDYLQKGFLTVDDVLQKAGAGSRGGKVIGYTSSGKPIYENFNHSEHKNFTASEHYEASKAHGKIAMQHSEAGDKHKESHHWQQAGRHNMAENKIENQSKQKSSSTDSKHKTHMGSKEFYDKHKEALHKHFQNYSEENLSSSEAAQEAGHSEKRSQESDSTAHEEHADAKIGTYARYKKHLDDIHAAVGHHFKKIKKD